MRELINPFPSCSKLLTSGGSGPGRMPAHHFSFHVRHPTISFCTAQDAILKTVDKMPILSKNSSKLQPFSQNDYNQVLSWWEQLELSKHQQLHFRDKPMKWFDWSMGILPDPQFSMERIELSKVIALVYVIDDIFDLLGSIEELTLFTRAVERWDNSELILMDSLPAYMKFFLQALYNTTKEIADLIMKEHGFNPIDSLRKLWTSLFRAFLVEAQWFRCESPPKANEYLENGVISTGVCVVLVHLNFLLGNGGDRKNVEKIPLLFSQIALILRLWDDLGSAEDENQDGFDGSYVDYYMKEHGVSLQTARKHTNQMISDAWSELNKEILNENEVSSTIKKAALNMVSMIKVMYTYENQTLPILEE